MTKSLAGEEEVRVRFKNVIVSQNIGSNMICGVEAILVILVEVIFGSLAILTQKAALESKAGNVEIVHAIAWAVEVLISVGAFFLLTILSCVEYVVGAFIIGLIILGAGTLNLYIMLKRK